VGAFLLFQVQPLISKIILPWFGGTPMVWTTCMLFFQVLLLLGYAYAHLLASLKSRALILVLHLSLLIVAVCLLPITPAASWKPSGLELSPVMAIMKLLLIHVGLPYFLLASTGPLLQCWFGREGQGSEKTYRLYALSNTASLLALLSYPLFFEIYFELSFQGRLWSIFFAVFVLMFALLALRTKVSLPALVKSSTEEKIVKPSLKTRLNWVYLPFTAVWALLAVTNHVCQDVAVVPFLWILPLTLYLLTFIIAFDKSRWYKWLQVALFCCGCILLLSVLQWFRLIKLHEHFILEAGLYFLALFVICFLCHGEVVKQKPDVKYLTSFYLMLSLGGALGGVFVTLICPRLFNTFLEMNLLLVIVYGFTAFRLLKYFLFASGGHSKILQYLSLAVLLFGFVIVVLAQLVETDKSPIEQRRNFYGILKVNDDIVAATNEAEAVNERVMWHGRTLHGSQSLTPGQELIPTSYYSLDSGLSYGIQHHARREAGLKMGVVGLGTGNIAAYGKENDEICFYEINPDVIDLANKYFTFLKECKAPVKTVLGDARLVLEREDSQNYDIMVLDAFSGDAVPVHLLTAEAISLYLRHLRRDGLLLVHISNRHLDLKPVLFKAATHFKLSYLSFYRPPVKEKGKTGSTWVILTADEEFLQNPSIQILKEKGLAIKDIPLWTDQYSNLFSIFR
jgi:spermidine synthase